VQTNVKAVELRDLWRRYKTDGDQKARDRLVVAYSPLVKYVAGRMGAGLPAHVDEADLISYGLGGLIAAIERFDTSREIRFETYAITRIKGAILDELRALDWVPRSVRARARQIERAHVKLEAKLQRVTDRGGARGRARAERSRSSAPRCCRSRTRRSARSTSCGARRTRAATRCRCSTRCATRARSIPRAIVEQNELRDRVAEALDRLPEREKLVIALYYYENLTLREIGEVLRVTESRVSQLHTKAVLGLRGTSQFR
jgi:RNA polymerase sigma factor for flagellar operon FliA